MTNISSIIESFSRQFWVEPEKFQDFYNFKLSNFPYSFTKLEPEAFKKEYYHKPEKAKTVFFDRIMFYSDKNNICFGKPLLNDFRVEASLLPGIRKKSKIVVFKRRAKKAYKRTIGYRNTSKRVRFDNVLKIISSKNRQNLQVLVKSTKS